MPIYEYKCEKCGARFELFFQSAKNEEKHIQCPNCNSEQIKKQISRVNSQITGVGKIAKEYVDQSYSGGGCSCGSGDCGCN
jgi:putative FmdB family regulatory protein